MFENTLLKTETTSPAYYEIVGMASAIDSGVDTGNDSNDSTVQEKLSKMDLSIDSLQENKIVDSAKQTSSRDGQGQQFQMLFSDRPTMVEEDDRPQSSAASSYQMSLTHLQPASLMHGYERNISQSDIEVKIDKRVSEIIKAMNPRFGVFVSGGPLGTEYKQNQIVRKSNRLTIRSPFYRAQIRKYKNDEIDKLRSRLAASPSYLKVKNTLKMCRAACHNDTQAMREMLEAGISPNCQDRYKRSPLHLAACMGFADMVKLLLDYGADPNVKDSIGNTPLHLAACTNHVAVITLLLKAGTRVSEKDLAGHSPLQLAITKFNIMKRSIMPHPVLKEQVCQVISMLTEYMRHKERPSVDPDLLNKFESLVRVSDSTEEVESNIRDLLSDLSSLSLSGPL